MSAIKQRLVLAHWMIHQLGFPDYEAGFTTLNEALKKRELGWDEQHVFHYRRAVRKIGRREIGEPNTTELERQLTATTGKITDNYGKLTFAAGGTLAAGPAKESPDGQT